MVPIHEENHHINPLLQCHFASVCFPLIGVYFE